MGRRMARVASAALLDLLLVAVLLTLPLAPASPEEAPRAATLILYTPVTACRVHDCLPASLIEARVAARYDGRVHLIEIPVHDPTLLSRPRAVLLSPDGRSERLSGDLRDLEDLEQLLAGW